MRGQADTAALTVLPSVRGRGHFREPFNGSFPNTELTQDLVVLFLGIYPRELDGSGIPFGGGEHVLELLATTNTLKITVCLKRVILPKRYNVQYLSIKLLLKSKSYRRGSLRVTVKPDHAAGSWSACENRVLGPTPVVSDPAGLG